MLNSMPTYSKFTCNVFDWHVTLPFCVDWPLLLLCHQVYFCSKSLWIMNNFLKILRAILSAETYALFMWMQDKLWRFPNALLETNGHSTVKHLPMHQEPIPWIAIHHPETPHNCCHHLLIPHKLCLDLLSPHQRIHKLPTPCQ